MSRCGYWDRDHAPLYRRRSDGLFLRCCNDVAKKYPSIEYNDMYIDKACLMVREYLIAIMV